MNPAREYEHRPLYANTGYGPNFSVLEIGLPDQVAVVEADRAFWAVVRREALEEALAGGLVDQFRKAAGSLSREMHQLRFGLKPSAVYFNPTERCNFNCSYCYLPEEMRRNGTTMTAAQLSRALGILRDYFSSVLPPGVKPQLIFHGSEPLLAREAVFAGIDEYRDDFVFGIQSNATLLDDEAITFLEDRGVGIGISLDAPTADLADRTRKNWKGAGAFANVVSVIEKLSPYPAFNVITTVTRVNVESLPAMVDFYHGHGVRTVLFNPVRVTRQGGLDLKPEDSVLARHFFRALDRAEELYRETGRKLVTANFANILAAILGPTSRRLMCDITPCGGGRCFFAVSARGEVFPCSEFIGFPRFNGGNLFKNSLSSILGGSPFRDVTSRTAERIVPCGNCAIRHFCGAPCPAEVHAVSGTLNAPSPYCAFYEEQVRYAFRVIARGREEAYLWDGWEEETEETFCWK